MRDITKFILESINSPKFKVGDVICQTGHNYDKSPESFHLVTDIELDKKRYILDGNYADENKNQFLIKDIDTDNFSLASNKDKWKFLRWTYEGKSDSEIKQAIKAIIKNAKYKNN